MPLGMSLVRLRSVDGGKGYIVDIKTAEQSTLIKDILKAMGHKDDDDHDVRSFPLLNVRSPILYKVLKYCAYHKDDPPEPHSKSNEICPWDQEFLDVDEYTFGAYVQAANYLRIEKLLNLTSKYIDMKSKKMRKNDWT